MLTGYGINKERQRGFVAAPVFIYFFQPIQCSLNHNGPWFEVVDESLPNSIRQDSPLHKEEFSFASMTARFVKFNLLTWYGAGGGLQYFNVKKTGKIKAI